MGLAFSDAGWEEDAIRAFETALAIDPEMLEAINGLGILYKRQGRFDLAMACVEKALACCPEDPGLQRNRAMLLGALGRLVEEEKAYRQIIATHPEDSDAHFGLAAALLLSGQLPEGWREYEWRWAPRASGDSVRAPRTSLPRWRGEPVDREQSALVIHAEQGFGDNIQFSRFLSMARERFARVKLQTRPPLLSLFRRSFGELGDVCADGVDETGYTHHCPLMSLPLAFGTTLETIPDRVPYLTVDPDRRIHWHEQLCNSKRPAIGVAWATGKRGMHKRSFELPLSALAPLFASAGFRWVSLNKEPLTQEQTEWLHACGVLDWSASLQDFDDTAALIDCLDLVISVDTATAHLAGALGKPVWLLNRAESEWRWLVERSDSPWYPTMRIFRQQRTRQWDSVIDAVMRALGEESGT